MLRKTIIPAIGFILLFSGTAFLIWKVWTEYRSHIFYPPLVSTKASYCSHPVMNVNIDRKVLSVEESEPLFVNLKHNGLRKTVIKRKKGANISPDDFERVIEDCPVHVELFAPNFDYEPKGSERKIILPSSGEVVQLTWVIAPKKVGKQTVFISAERESAVITLTVISTLGLSAKQLTVLSYLATFFGSALTFTRLYEQFKNWRRKKHKSKVKETLTRNRST